MEETIFENNVGHPYIAIIIPFIFPASSIANNVCSISKKSLKEYSSDMIISGDSKGILCPMLQNFFENDKDEYSFDYLRTHKHYRMVIEDHFEIENTTLYPVITIREDGYGSIILIYQNQNNMSVKELLDFSDRIRSSIDSPNNTEVREVIEKYFKLFYGIEVKEVAVGKSYPYYNIFYENNGIHELSKFVEDHCLSVYGILHQDYNYWTDRNVALKMLDANLSRRNCYSFYVTSVAAVEIDNEERRKLINKWIAKDGMSFEMKRLETIVEKILSLETLVTQKLLLQNIDRTIEKIICSPSATSRDILNAKSKISDDLFDYHNIKSQNESHVSGVEWIEYGQKRMGIEKLYESLLSRIELLDSLMKDKEVEQRSKGNFFLTLFSIIFSLNTVISISAWVFSAPFFENSNKLLIWIITLVCTIILGAIMVTIYFVFNKTKRSKNDNKRRKHK